MLDKRDFSPVGYKRYSKESGKEVEWTDVVKGYEYEKGQYMVLSDEDFKRANVKATRTSNPFVRPCRRRSPGVFRDTLLSGSGDRGEKVYALLRETCSRPAASPLRKSCCGPAASRRPASGRARADDDHTARPGRDARRPGSSCCGRGPEGGRFSQGTRPRERLIEDMSVGGSPPAIRTRITET